MEWRAFRLYACLFGGAAWAKRSPKLAELADKVRALHHLEAEHARRDESPWYLPMAWQQYQDEYHAVKKEANHGSKDL